MARLARSDTPFWKDAFKDAEPLPQYSFEARLVFVLMDMANAVKSAATFAAIKAGCHAVDLTATRVDETPGSSIIMRDVDRSMSLAEFLVFDLTNERPNVYYELGYARGIGNHASNILLVAHQGTRIHFDISPLRVHFYRSLADLQSIVTSQLKELKRVAQTAR